MGERGRDPQSAEGRAGNAPDDRRPVRVGLALWLVALLAAIAGTVSGALPSAVLWTCVAGVILGVAGLAYTQRRARLR